jgi:hypothetical protein
MPGRDAYASGGWGTGRGVASAARCSLSPRSPVPLKPSPTACRSGSLFASPAASSSISASPKSLACSPPPLSSWRRPGFTSPHEEPALASSWVTPRLRAPASSGVACANYGPSPSPTSRPRSSPPPRWRPSPSIIFTALPRRQLAARRGREALEEDCRIADIVIVPFSVGKGCSTARVVVDLEGLSIRSESVAETRGRRPWVPERAGSKPSLSAGQAYAAILALPMMTMMMMMPSIASSTAIPMSEA